MTTTADNFAARAALLTARGIPVVPVAPGEKGCKLTDWPALATTDLAQIEAWSQTADFNTAAVCLPDGICVLDADSAELLDHIPQPLPKTFTTQSAGKRLPHFYFLQTDRSRELGNCKAAKLFDFQQSRKYVVGPGSRLADGRTYDIIDGSPIVPIPNWLCDWIAENAIAEKQAETEGFGDAPVVAEDFDFDALMAHYDIGGNWNGIYFETDACPVAGRRHEQASNTRFRFDGQRLGFKCFAASCPGSGMSVGDVIAHLNRSHAPYPKAIWQAEEAGHYVKTADGRMMLFDSAETKAKWVAENGHRLPAEPRGRTLKPSRPIVEGVRMDFVLDSSGGDRFNGWFARGLLHGVGGGSGAGKTTFMLDLLDQQKRGNYVLGHVGRRLDYLVLFSDRGRLANETTLDRLGLINSNVPIDYVSTDVMDRDAALEVIRMVEAREKLPEVLLIDGADLMITDVNKPGPVSSFMKPLRMLAEWYHISIVVAVGAKKAQVGDAGNISSRDDLIGTSAWSRYLEDTITIKRVGNAKSGQGHKRELIVDHHNGAPEVFDMEFKLGRLVESKHMEEIDPLRLWICQRSERFTQQDAVQAAKDGGWGEGFKSTNVYYKLAAYVEAGDLAKAYDDRKLFYYPVAAKAVQ
jgi:hypothetical protein